MTDKYKKDLREWCSFVKKNKGNPLMVMTDNVRRAKMVGEMLDENESQRLRVAELEGVELASEQNEEDMGNLIKSLRAVIPELVRCLSTEVCSVCEKLYGEATCEHSLADHVEAYEAIQKAREVL
jgi:hypothetical protein